MRGAQLSRFVEPLLRVLVIAPNGLGTRQAQDALADLLGLSTEDWALRVPNGSQFVFRHRTNLGARSLKACWPV